MTADASLPSRPPAALPQRAAAAVLDAALCGAVGVGVGFLVSSVLGVSSGTRPLVVYLVALAAGWLYCSLLESSSRQATFGKRVFGLLVTDLEGERLTFGRASLRFFAKTASALPALAGFAMAAFTPRRQALHDLLGLSLVLQGHAGAGESVPLAARSASPPAASGPGLVPNEPRAPVPFQPAAAPAPTPVSPPISVINLVGVDPASSPGPQQRLTPPQPRPDDHDGHTVLIDAAYAPTILAAPKRGWTLAAVSGADAGRSFELGWEARIGREPDNTIRLADEKASRHHAVVARQPDGYLLTDLGSSNGTLVDGERIGEPRLLRAGAEITIGNTRLVLRSPAATTH